MLSVLDLTHMRIVQLNEMSVPKASQLSNSVANVQRNYYCLLASSKCEPISDVWGALLFKQHAPIYYLYNKYSDVPARVSRYSIPNLCFSETFALLTIN